jgi:hypothetical protein
MQRGGFARVGLLSVTRVFSFSRLKEYMKLLIKSVI